MPIEKPVARICGEPRREKGAGRVRVAALVADMGETMRAMGVVWVCRHRLLDLRSGRRELPILGKRHRVIGREPKITAVVRGQIVHHLSDLALLSDAAGTADHSVGVRGYGNNQRVTRPCREMPVQGGDCRLGSAGEYKIEKTDVAAFAFGQT